MADSSGVERDSGGPDVWSVVLGISVTVALGTAGFVIGIAGSGKAGDTHSFWYLSRSAGVVAYLLMWGSVAWGILLSARSHWSFLRPATALDAHQFLSNTALGFGFFHALVLAGDRYIGQSLSQLLAPFGSTYEPILVAFGQIGLWLSLFVSLSWLIRSKLGNRRWRAFHMTSYGAYWIVFLHAIYTGGTSRSLPLIALYTVLAALIVLLTAYRIWRSGVDRRAQPETA